MLHEFFEAHRGELLDGIIVLRDHGGGARPWCAFATVLRPFASAGLAAGRVSAVASLAELGTTRAKGPPAK